MCNNYLSSFSLEPAIGICALSGSFHQAGRAWGYILLDAVDYYCQSIQDTLVSINKLGGGVIFVTIPTLAVTFQASSLQKRRRKG